MKGRGSKEGVVQGGGSSEGTKTAVPLHNIGDEPRVMQEEEGVATQHPEAADQVGPLGKVPGRDLGEHEGYYHSPEVSIHIFCMGAAI